MVSSDVQQWTPGSGTSIFCQNGNIFGPLSQGIKQKTFNGLKPHWQKSVQIELSNINSVDYGGPPTGPDFLQLNLVGKFSYTLNQNGINGIYPDLGCGGSVWNYRALRYMYIPFQDSDSTLLIKFYGQMTEPWDNEAWGISKLWFYIDICDSSCKSCSGSEIHNCITCPSQSTVYTSLKGKKCLCDKPNYAHEYQCVPSCPSGYLADDFDRKCVQQCPDNCQACSSQKTCTSCITNFYLLHGQCYDRCPNYCQEEYPTNFICNDTDYSTIFNPHIVHIDFVKKLFGSAEVINNGWIFQPVEQINYSGKNFDVTSYATTQCGDKVVALGHSVLFNSKCDNPECSFQKVFKDLPPHFGVNLKFTFYAGNTWTGEELKVYVDGVQVHTIQYTSILKASAPPYVCGRKLNHHPSDYIINVNIPKISHYYSQLLLKFAWTTSIISANQWVGFRDFQLTLFKCPDECQNCVDASGCKECSPDKDDPPACSIPNAGYFDIGTPAKTFSLCAYKCKACQGSYDNCTECKFYNDPDKIPTCSKPANCMFYVSVESYGTNQGNDFKYFFDGVEQTFTSKSQGICIVNIHKTTKVVVDQKCFDTNSLDESQITQMIAFIDAIEYLNIVVSGVMGSGPRLLTQVAYSALHRIGWTPGLEIFNHDGIAVLSKKSNFGHDAGHVRHAPDGSNIKAQVEACSIECDWVCAECSGTPSNCTKCRYYNSTPPPSCQGVSNCLSHVEVVSQIGDMPNDKLEIKINGIQQSIPFQQGFTVMEINEKFEPQQPRNFNTAESSIDVSDLIEYIKSIDKYHFVVSGLKGKIGDKLNQNSEIYSYLKLIGIDEQKKLLDGSAHLVIGKKLDISGKASDVFALEQLSVGIANRSKCIQQCDIQCATCQNNQNTCVSCSHSSRSAPPFCILPKTCGTYVYAKSLGFLHSPYLSQGKKSEIYINDIYHFVSKNRGIQMIQLNELGEVEDDSFKKAFDFSTDSTILIQMKSWVQSIPTGRKVIVVVNEDGQKNLDAKPEGYEALQMLGLDISFQLGYRQPFIMIGEKGAKSGSVPVVTGVDKPGAAEWQGCIYQCQIQCSTCHKTPKQCTQCSDLNRTRIPECKCRKGFYQKLGDPKCYSCPIQCKECTDEYTCTVCAEMIVPGKYDNSEQNRFPVPNCKCHDGYFLNNLFKCESCEFPCKKCNNNSKECATCVDGLNRKLPPSCECIEGYYQDKNNICQKCQFPCIQCKNVFECISCVQEYNRLILPPCYCVDGYYQHYKTQKCTSCPSKCKKCLDQQLCLVCSDPKQFPPSCYSQYLSFMTSLILVLLIFI